MSVENDYAQLRGVMQCARSVVSPETVRFRGSPRAQGGQPRSVVEGQPLEWFWDSNGRCQQRSVVLVVSLVETAVTQRKSSRVSDIELEAW